MAADVSHTPSGVFQLFQEIFPAFRLILAALSHQYQKKRKKSVY